MSTSHASSQAIPHEHDEAAHDNLEQGEAIHDNAESMHTIEAPDTGIIHKEAFNLYTAFI